MIPRFHVPEARTSGEVVALPGDEAIHLVRVLRLKQGDAVRIFNGRGDEFDAVVEVIGRVGVSVHVGEARRPTPEARVAITLAQAVLKGDKMDDVVRDAVMLGVEVVQPIICEHAEATRASLARGRRRERWERIAVASAKQCGRATVPRVCDPIDFDVLLQGIAGHVFPTPALMCIEPRPDVTAAKVSQLDLPRPSAATVIVGPEGGWSGAEIARGAPVARPVTLGDRTLRADSAPVIALTALLTIWGEF